MSTENTMPCSTRRSLSPPVLLAGTAAVAPGSGGRALCSPQGPGVYRYTLGDYQLTALYDGTWFLPIDDKFVRNASGRAGQSTRSPPPSCRPTSCR